MKVSIHREPLGDERQATVTVEEQRRGDEARACEGSHEKSDKNFIGRQSLKILNGTSFAAKHSYFGGYPRKDLPIILKKAAR